MEGSGGRKSHGFADYCCSSMAKAVSALEAKAVAEEAAWVSRAAGALAGKPDCVPFRSGPAASLLRRCEALGRDYIARDRKPRPFFDEMRATHAPDDRPPVTSFPGKKLVSPSAVLEPRLLRDAPPDSAPGRIPETRDVQTEDAGVRKFARLAERGAS